MAPKSFAKPLDLDLSRRDLRFEILDQPVVGRLHRGQLGLPRCELRRHAKVGRLLGAQIAIERVGMGLKSRKIAREGDPNDPLVLIGLLRLDELIFEAVSLDSGPRELVLEGVSLALESVAIERHRVIGAFRDTTGQRQGHRGEQESLDDAVRRIHG